MGLFSPKNKRGIAEIFLFKRPTRILLSLYKNEKFVRVISEELNIHQPNVSTYLKKFHELGLITRTKKGKTTIYSLTNKGKKLSKALILFEKYAE